MAAAFMEARTVDGSLSQLAQRLGPSAEADKFAKSRIERIFTTIKENSKFQYARMRCLGGIDKHTSSWVKHDYDLVIFVQAPDKDYKTLFVEIIAEWRGILENQLRYRKEDIKIIGSFGLSVNVDNVETDLILAVNLVQPDRFLPVDQAKAALREIRESPASADLLTASMAEESVAFIKRQSPFAHDVMRLAKFWLHMLLPKPRARLYVPGRSVIVELLSLHCAHKEENEKRGNPSRKNAMIRFFTLLWDFKDIRIIFDSNVYSRQEIPAHNLREPPYLIDPVNPFNNYLSNRSKIISDNIMKFLEELSNRGKETLERISTPRDLIDPLFDFFLAHKAMKIREVSFNRDVIAGICQAKCIFPSVSINKELHKDERRLAMEISLVLKCLTALTPWQTDPLRHLQSLSDVMWTNLGIPLLTDNQWSVEEHKQHDFTVNIPVPNLNGISISVNFYPPTIIFDQNDLN